MDIEAITGQADYALYEVRLVGRERRFKNYHLLPLGIAPKRDMPICERHAGVVADATHD